MTKQPHLWDACTATVRTTQGDLFAGRPVTVGLCCVECGRELVQTESGYGCCPAGHGRLVLIDTNNGEK